MKLSFKTRAELEDWATQQILLFERPCLVLLDGNLGAGKTQLVRWFCAALGSQETASPTFAIHHEYTTASGPVGHVDLYRVKSDADLEGSGFWDLLNDPNGLLFIEWADRLPTEVWPAAWTQVHIRLEKGDAEEARDLTLEIKKS